MTNYSNFGAVPNPWQDPGYLAAQAQKHADRQATKNAILTGYIAGSVIAAVTQPVTQNRVPYLSLRKRRKLAQRASQSREEALRREDQGMKDAAARIRSEMIAAGTWPRPEDYPAA